VETSQLSNNPSTQSSVHEPLKPETKEQQQQQQPQQQQQQQQINPSKETAVNPEKDTSEVSPVESWPPSLKYVSFMKHTKVLLIQK
jgi:transcription initiation factor TFIID subunit TAF12